MIVTLNSNIIYDFSPTQILCSTGDITPIRNGEVPLHPAYGGAAADEHAEHGEGVCHCSPARTEALSRWRHGLP